MNPHPPVTSIVFLFILLFLSHRFPAFHPFAMSYGLRAMNCIAPQGTQNLELV
jgi:hypothetical protein